MDDAPITGDDRLERLRRLAHWLDDGIRLPIVGWRIGLDPIIGLLPGVGDTAGAVLSGVILLAAVRRGVSRFTLSRMAWNIALDALIGTVPLIGDVFDAAWKANLRNVALLERQAALPVEARKADRRYVVLLLGSLGVLCAGLAAASVFLTVWLVGIVAAHLR